MASPTGPKRNQQLVISGSGCHSSPLVIDILDESPRRHEGSSTFLSMENLIVRALSRNLELSRYARRLLNKSFEEPILLNPKAPVANDLHRLRDEMKSLWQGEEFRRSCVTGPLPSLRTCTQASEYVTVARVITRLVAEDTETNSKLLVTCSAASTRASDAADMATVQDKRFLGMISTLHQEFETDMVVRNVETVSLPVLREAMQQSEYAALRYAKRQLLEDDDPEAKLKAKRALYETRHLDESEVLNLAESTPGAPLRAVLMHRIKQWQDEVERRHDDKNSCELALRAVLHIQELLGGELVAPEANLRHRGVRELEDGPLRRSVEHFARLTLCTVHVGEHVDTQPAQDGMSPIDGLVHFMGKQLSTPVFLVKEACVHVLHFACGWPNAQLRQLPLHRLVPFMLAEKTILVLEDYHKRHLKGMQLAQMDFSLQRYVLLSWSPLSVALDGRVTYSNGLVSKADLLKAAQRSMLIGPQVITLGTPLDCALSDDWQLRTVRPTGECSLTTDTFEMKSERGRVIGYETSHPYGRVVEKYFETMTEGPAIMAGCMELELSPDLKTIIPRTIIFREGSRRFVVKPDHPLNMSMFAKCNSEVLPHSVFPNRRKDPVDNPEWVTRIEDGWWPVYDAQGAEVQIWTLKSGREVMVPFSWVPEDKIDGVISYKWTDTDVTGKKSPSFLNFLHLYPDKRYVWVDCVAHNGHPDVERAVIQRAGDLFHAKRDRIMMTYYDQFIRGRSPASVMLEQATRGWVFQEQRDAVFAKCCERPVQPGELAPRPGSEETRILPLGSSASSVGEEPLFMQMMLDQAGYYRWAYAALIHCVITGRRRLVSDAPMRHIELWNLVDDLVSMCRSGQWRSATDVELAGTRVAVGPPNIDFVEGVLRATIDVELTVEEKQVACLHNLSNVNFSKQADIIHGSLRRLPGVDASRLDDPEYTNDVFQVAVRRALRGLDRPIPIPVMGVGNPTSNLPQGVTCAIAVADHMLRLHGMLADEVNIERVIKAVNMGSWVRHELAPVIPVLFSGEMTVVGRSNVRAGRDGALASRCLTLLRGDILVVVEARAPDICETPFTLRTNQGYPQQLGIQL